MKAAIVHAYGEPPRYGEFAAPRAESGEIVITVQASSVSPLALTRVSGAHYSAGISPPFVAGVDGVGTTPEGRAVYFGFPRPPFGSLAEETVVALDHTLPLPRGIDLPTAAAAAIPGMSSWIPLMVHAPIRPGESVLVNGATGIAGRLAVQVAKHLGAHRVIATGRSETTLRPLAALGADVLLPLDQPPEAFREAVRREARDSAIGVVLDYLWGSPAELILSALGGPMAPRGPARIRFVQIGQMAGATITLGSALLRSSGVELVGSGIGSSTDAEVFRRIGEFLEALATRHFRIVTKLEPLASVEQVWPRSSQAARLVFTIP